MENLNDAMIYYLWDTIKYCSALLLINDDLSPAGCVELKPATCVPNARIEPT